MFAVGETYLQSSSGPQLGDNPVKIPAYELPIPFGLLAFQQVEVAGKAALNDGEHPGLDPLEIVAAGPEMAGVAGSVAGSAKMARALGALAVRGGV